VSGPSVLSRHRVIALVTAGVVAGAAGGFVVSQLGVATASSPSPSPSVGPALRPGFGPGIGAMGLLGGLAGGGKLLHGEATVAKPGGGTNVLRFQNGTITAINGSSMTVKSTDGFSATYTVDKTSRITLNGADGTLSTLTKNDKVRVLAMQNGSSNIAKMVLDGVPAFGLLPGMRGGGLDRAFRHRERLHQAPDASPGATSGENG
jgi:hypothetical protein